MLKKLRTSKNLFCLSIYYLFPSFDPPGHPMHILKFGLDFPYILDQKARNWDVCSSLYSTPGCSPSYSGSNPGVREKPSKFDRQCPCCHCRVHIVNNFANTVSNCPCSQRLCFHHVPVVNDYADIVSVKTMTMSACVRTVDDYSTGTCILKT